MAARVEALAVFPSVAITATILAINLAGDTVRDALDPGLSNAAD